MKKIAQQISFHPLDFTLHPSFFILSRRFGGCCRWFKPYGIVTAWKRGGFARPFDPTLNGIVIQPMARKTTTQEENPAKESASPAQPRPTSGSLFGLCLAAWLVPGLGHFLLGRKGRAVVLFLAIVGMFVFGLAMQGQFFAAGSGSYLHTLGYFAELSIGVPMTTATFFGYGGGNVYFICSDYGTAFLISAGMLNVLTILDAYDIALGRKS
jgi:hypothetical protein